MYADIVELREFYDSGLGRATRRLLRSRLAEIWPQMQGERVLALGYGVPLLRPWREQAALVAALMPAEQGVAYWPREGPNISALIDPADLPLTDQSIDRIVLLHGLEGAANPDSVLREIWRVLKGHGRVVIIVPNRRGVWAHSDRTPFGSGQPYSTRQLKDILRRHGFLADRVWHSLYLPPFGSRLLLKLSELAERIGEKLFPGFGGVLVVEAGKQLYAPIAPKSRFAQRLVLPLPLLPVPTRARVFRFSGGKAGKP